MSTVMEEEIKRWTNSVARFSKPILWRMMFWLRLLMGLLLRLRAVLMKIRTSIKTGNPTFRQGLLSDQV